MLGDQSRTHHQLLCGEAVLGVQFAGLDPLMFHRLVPVRLVFRSLFDPEPVIEGEACVRPVTHIANIAPRRKTSSRLHASHFGPNFLVRGRAHPRVAVGNVHVRPRGVRRDLLRAASLGPLGAPRDHSSRFQRYV